MRILQVTSATRMKYGAMNAMLLLGDGLKAKGISVTYCGFTGRGGTSELKARDEAVIEVPVRLKIDPVGAFLLSKRIKALGIEVVHTHLSTSSLVGCLAAKWARVPSVATVHGLSGIKSFYFADHLIAVSQAVKDHLVSQGREPNSITVVRNGIQADVATEIERHSAKKQLGLEDYLVFGMSGRITALKGIQEAIQALAACDKDLLPTKWKCLILGDGEDRAACESVVQELGLTDRIQFLGFVNPVRPYLCALDILLFPTFKEAMPLALLEAGMCGATAIAFATGGVPEVLTEGSGILVPTGDTKAMSHAILELAADPVRRLQMSREAQRIAQTQFSVDRMVTETIAVYSRLIQQKK